MYPRVFSSSGEPGGRGPNSTCLRTCSNARSPSKSDLRDESDDDAFEGVASTGLLAPLGQPSSISEAISTNARVRNRDERFGGSFNEGVWSLIMLAQIDRSGLEPNQTCLSSSGAPR